MNYLGWDNLITLLFGGGITGLITAWYSKRKAKADATSSELDNAQKIINMQNEFITDQSDRYTAEKKEWVEKFEQLQKRIADLEKKLANQDELQQEIATLTKKVKVLEQENTQLKMQINKLGNEKDSVISRP